MNTMFFFFFCALVVNILVLHVVNTNLLLEHIIMNISIRFLYRNKANYNMQENRFGLKSYFFNALL